MNNQTEKDGPFHKLLYLQRERKGKEDEEGETKNVRKKKGKVLLTNR